MREITSLDYDNNVLREGIQFQIDTFYEPRDIFAKRRIETVLAALQPAPGELILDVGCGVGTFSFHSARCGARTVGIDFSPESIRIAGELAARYGLANTARYLVGRVQELPFEDGSFDKVVVADVIEHITDNEKHSLCAGISRVLKPGGIAVFFTPNKKRETLGTLYWQARHFLLGDNVPSNDLHYGLITRTAFEKILTDNGLTFRCRYTDITRPYLARIPLKSLVALNLLWTARKHAP
jgi:2-polyprenyl-3-methyl-5-hydroxy-6-metoxy-1,4-benzoquinol methylase